MEDGIRIGFLVWALAGYSLRERKDAPLLIQTNNTLIAALALGLIFIESYDFLTYIASGGLTESIAFYKRATGWYFILYIPFLISPLLIHLTTQLFWVKQFRRNAPLGLAVALLLNLPLFLDLTFPSIKFPPFHIWDNDFLPAAWVYHISQWGFFPTLTSYFILLWTILLFMHFRNKRRSG